MRLANHVSLEGPDAIRHSLLQRAPHRSLSKSQLISVVADAEEAIESLPLTTGEYCVASNRLRNARRYLRSDERAPRCTSCAPDG